MSLKNLWKQEGNVQLCNVEDSLQLFLRNWWMVFVDNVIEVRALTEIEVFIERFWFHCGSKAIDTIMGLITFRHSTDYGCYHRLRCRKRFKAWKFIFTYKYCFSKIMLVKNRENSRHLSTKNKFKCLYVGHVPI